MQAEIQIDTDNVLYIEDNLVWIEDDQEPKVYLESCDLGIIENCIANQIAHKITDVHLHQVMPIPSSFPQCWLGLDEVKWGFIQDYPLRKDTMFDIATLVPFHAALKDILARMGDSK